MGMAVQRKQKGEMIHSLKGFTLFEVLIALALFAIIIVPVMRSFVTAMRVNEKGREVMVATDVANSLMEGVSGKTYEQVVRGLLQAEAGFDLTDDSKETAVKLSRKFSSINDDYYNKGNCALGVLNGGADPGKYDASFQIDGLTISDDNKVSGEAVGLDQKIAKRAIDNLRGIANSTTPPSPAETDTTDKKLYFGFTAKNRYADTSSEEKGFPKACYMMYTRIQKEKYYFDAIITFLPRAMNGAYTNTSTNVDDFFVYEVTVTVYPYEFDPNTSTWKGRFDEKGNLEGEPAVILTGGIMNRDIQATL